MEDYRLQQSGQEVQDILNGAAMQVDLTAEESRAKAAEKQNADDIDAIEEKIPFGASSSNKFATESDVNDASQTLQGNIDAEALRAGQAEQVLDGKIDAEETRAKAAEKANADDIDAIEEKIPSGASSSNKLTTEDYVNNKVATDSATFRGTYNLVSNLGLLPTATHDQIAYALSGEIATADNNDYAYVQIPTSAETPTEIAKIERYKFDGSAWAFEYELNNSGFTAAQWAAINSGITSGDVTKLAALPTSSELTTLLNGKQDTLTFDNVPTQGSNNPVKSGGVYSGIKAEEERAKAAEKLNADNIEAIEEKIPSGASSSNKMATAGDISSLDAAIEAIMLLIPSAATSLNQLADKAFVNSSIATATATFRGTYNLVNDLGLMVSSTHAQIATALGGAVSGEDNNDYAFVQVPTSDATPTQIAKTERYKFNGTEWEYEYDLNNSGYTADQWAAINSGITQALVTKLSALPTNADLTTALGVLTDGIAAINGKIPSAASSSNKLVDNSAMVAYIGQIIDAIDVTFNVTSTDGHVTVQITQVNGVITAVNVTTSDIASAADLSLVAGRVTTAEGNISTNAQDIAALQAAYTGLTQNDCIVVAPTDTWPVSNPSQNIIYRVVDRVNTPPQYYSDYMWNGTTMVQMAQYNNAIDPRPKKGSQNLVTSGGVFDNMGALDVSELNATENPHTIATYVDLSAAIAAIPSDYQKGGMSVKFVLTSDKKNKYVQYRLMSDTFNITVANWQGVDDEPTAGSENLVKSGGVYDSIKEVSDVVNGKVFVDTPINDSQLHTLLTYEDVEIGAKLIITVNIPSGGGEINILARDSSTIKRIASSRTETYTIDSNFGSIIAKWGHITRVLVYENNGLVNSVLYIEQSLTEQQKEIARNNIGAISYTEVINKWTTRNKIYGVSINNTTGDVSRIADAIGMNNDYIVGSSFVNGGNNDFDNIFPWSDIKLCNVSVDASGNKTVTYEGESGFTRNGTNGAVMVEIPKFYTRRKVEGNTEEICITGEKKSGFVVEPAFYDSSTGKELEYIYVSVYESCLENGQHTSKSGTIPTTYESLLTFRSAGEMYDFATLQAIQKLFMIEFGAINTSAFFLGLGRLPFGQSYKCTEIEGTNKAKFKGGLNLRNLYVGAVVFVGDIESGIPQNRVITELGEYTQTDNEIERSITFSGSEVTMTVGTTFIHCTGQKNGLCDSMTYHTGRPLVINTPGDATDAFKYRHMENLWGNIGELMDGVRVKDLNYYYSYTKEDYDDLSKYTKLSYVAPEQASYDYYYGLIKRLGYDRKNPTVSLPSIITSDGSGTNYNKYYGDLFCCLYLESPEGREIPEGTEFVGISSMAWDGDNRNGLFMFRFWSQENERSWLYGTRMIYRTK